MELTDFKGKIKLKKPEFYEKMMEEHNQIFRAPSPGNLIVAHLEQQKKKMNRLADSGTCIELE